MFEDKQPYILISVAYPLCPSSKLEYWPRHDSSIPCRMVDLTNQGFHFLRSNGSIRDNIRTLIQFRNERKSQHPKR